MDLSGDWKRIRRLATKRLANNKTTWHISEYGDAIEILGVAGEIVARRFLGLPDDIHTTFDGGTDLMWMGYTVDVKASRLTRELKTHDLMWPITKPVKADIVLLTVISPEKKTGYPVGWAWGAEVTRAKVNRKRDQPCHEIPIANLQPLWGLLTLEPR